MIAAIAATIPAPFSPAGLHRILADGFLPLPGLSGHSADFPAASNWKTDVVDGAVKVIDAEGLIISAELRMKMTVEGLGIAGARNQIGMLE